jgi:DNA (cytosine-5)-methyltransferase 1
VKYLSVCSGIEAATVAWHHMGWQPVAFSEIEKFPAQVLAHHYPDVPNYGDMTKFMEWPNESIDLLVGGTPCQSFSVAGLRRGMADPRGNLALTYLGIADRYKPRWIVWENVTGVLSSNGGRDFGSFLGALAQLGYGFAYRVLDARFFGVAQRRRRVFVVGYLGDWRRAAAVLFESPSGRRDHSPSREKRQSIAPTVVSDPPFSRTGNARVEADALVARMVAFGEYVDDGTASAMKARDYKDATDLVAQPVAYQSSDGVVRECGNVMGTLDAARESRGSSQQRFLMQQMAVRRLTPTECERLQGFPDGYTNIEWYECCGIKFSLALGKYGCPNCEGEKTARLKTAADGSRYKSLGNSMAVPVMRWIGERIDEV